MTAKTTELLDVFIEKEKSESQVGFLRFPIRFPFRFQIEESILQSQQEQKSRKVLHL